MKKLIAIILVLLLCSASVAFAGSTPAFYRVTDGEGHEIFLLGTIHSCFPEALEFPDVIWDAFDRSEVLALELDMVKIQEDASLDGNGMTEEEMNAMLTDVLTIMYSETPLNELLGEEDFLKCCELLEVEPETVEHISAGFLTTYLGQKMAEKAGCSQDSGVDIFLARKAHDVGKTVIELENISDQMDALYDAPLELQVKEAKDAIAYFDESVEQIAVMSQAWARGDTEALMQIFFADSGSGEEEYSQEQAEYDAQLGTDRNEKFVLRAKEFLAEGRTAFIAIGAAHIFADDGLVRVLADEGYTVEQLCP